MKTTISTLRTSASAMPATTSNHTLSTLMRRLSMLGILLATFVLGARAASYVISYNGNYLYINDNGQIANSTYFHPNYIWEGGNGSKFSNNGYYLVESSNTLSTSQTESNGTNWTVNNNDLYFESGSNWSSTSYRGIKYNNGTWQTEEKTYNRWGGSSVDFDNVLYAITISKEPEASRTILEPTSATVSLTSNYIELIVDNDPTVYTASATAIVKKTFTRPAYDKYAFNSNTYYYVGENSISKEPSEVEGDPETLLPTFHWDIAGEGASFLTCNSNEAQYSIKVSSNPDKDETATLSVFAVYGDNIYTTPTTTTNITIKRKLYPPTGITIQGGDITLIKGETATISYTLEPQGAYDDVEFSISDESIASVNGAGVVTGKKAGSTQLTATAYKTDGSVACSTACNISVLERCAAPTIRISNGTKVTISCSSPADATIYYTTNGNEPTTQNGNGSNEYKGEFTITSGTVVKAIAIRDGWAVSELSTAIAGGTGDNASNPYYIYSTEDLEYIASHTSYHYKVMADFDASGFSSSISDFSGTFDGNYMVITGLRRPLFTSVNGGTIKNVVLDDVSITGTESTDNIGGIVATAEGATRIYNCGVRATHKSSISGGTNTGGIVGGLEGTSRVINCYSFADITGGTTVGGIVGNNKNASTTANNNLKTLVINCMYYGNITGGNNKAPIYNGEIITNVGANGINNYNYYRYSSDYSLNGDIQTYNCALAAEERYLVRHEFYRGILNSNKELCGWYITGQTNQSGIIGKWVLDTSIAPYPIIKPQGRYVGLVNRFITRDDASSLSTEERKGRVLYDEGNGGYLEVTVKRGDYGSGSSSVILDLPITDMNYDTYDYNYAKVVLPFYNQYFEGNYTNNKVVTGWEITSITGNGVETTGTNAYNYADRDSEEKDKGRIFAQGGYYNVPKGVKAITIEAKWADAVYLSDEYYDRAGYDLNNLTTVGQRYKNNTNYTINGSSQKVYTSLANAFSNLSQGATVYDRAVVLVGNYHSNSDDWNPKQNNNNKPFTLMSADLDNDNEPDYCVFHYHDNRLTISPARFDFLWHPGIGMAHKANEATNMLNQGIFHPSGWFEMTETALARYTEFEYGYGDNAPIILNNGIFEQFVTRRDNTKAQKSYLILGGNLYMKQFSPGVHVDNIGKTKHCPISVLGGEFENFYLSGMFRTISNDKEDNVMCYTNGGKFGRMAGSGHEQIDANIWFKINNSIIDEFYGGGINANNPVTGNINVQIDNSYVEKYCAGPMFGSMQTDKTVTTTANGTTFGRYYGAGNGGTSLNRQTTNGKGSGSTDYDWADWMSEFYQSLTYDSNLGIQVEPEYEYFAWAGGTGSKNVGRFYVNYAKFDKAQTNSVKSTLTNCTILDDYYGGGNLSYVNGNAVSELTGCTVYGNVYGGGYSAEVPTVTVYPNGFKKAPSYNGNVGVYNLGEYNDPTIYTWSNKAGLSQTKLTDGNLIWSDVRLENLGEVGGNTTVTIKGNAQISGGVYGGGNASKVSGTTTVNIEAAENSFINEVYGGANQADVGGSTTVNIKSGKVGSAFGTNNLSGTKNNSVVVNITGGTSNYVYGAGNQASYNGNPQVEMQAGIVKEAVFGGGLGTSATVDGNPKVNMTGGTVGYTKTENNQEVVCGGDVFGGGNAAIVNGNTSVTITAGEVKRNVYGGGNQAAVSGTTEVKIGSQSQQ